MTKLSGPNMLSLLFVIASLYIPGVSATEIAPAKVFGHVYQAGTIIPISGAIVQTIDGDCSVMTDSSGYYYLPLPSGDHVVQASAVSYQSCSWVVNVSENDVRKDFFLLPLGARLFQVSGSVSIQGGGELVTDAMVSIPSIGYAASTGDGSYSFMLPNGTFECVVTGMRYNNASFQVTIEDSNVVRDIYLVQLERDAGPMQDHWPVMTFVVAAALPIGYIAISAVIRRKKKRV